VSSSGSIAIIYHALPNNEFQNYIRSASAYLAFSNDNGKTWTNSSLRIFPDSTFISQVDFGKNDALFLRALDGSLYRSTDRGKTFFMVSNLPRVSSSVVLHPQGTFLVIADGNLYTSTDNGQTWSKYSTIEVQTIRQGVLNAKTEYFFADFRKVFKMNIENRSIETVPYFTFVDDYINNISYYSINNFFQISLKQIFAIGNNTNDIHYSPNGGFSWGKVINNLPKAQTNNIR
jgi:hypothetical protein